MTLRKLSTVLTVLFLAVTGIFLLVRSLKRPRVLILHSYATDYDWVRGIDEGITRVLGTRPYNIRYHYMDTKRHPSQDFIEKAGTTAQVTIDEWQPDVLIAIDDNAQKYAAMHYIKKSDKPPELSIVFAGVSAELPAYGYDKAPNVTGIVEHVPSEAARAILLELLPRGRRRVLVISDDSENALSIHEQIRQYDWRPIEIVGIRPVGTLDRWKETVLAAESQVDCLIITNYHTIRESGDSRVVVKPADIVKWTEENTKLPTLGFWGFFVEDGGMMAAAVSPYEQGETAGEKAVQIIEGQIDPMDVKEKLKVDENHVFVMYIRQASVKERLHRRDVPLILESFSRAVNHYYE
jgi:ABC-type uncharacterized transport system substrate-binding protein